jgi:hypothetical protein
MRIHRRLAILSVLVVALLAFGISSATPAFAAATKSKHDGFKAAQTKAHRILTGTAMTNPSDVVPAQQINLATNQPTVWYSGYAPGWNGPVYTWFIPAQQYNASPGQSNVAAGSWQVPAGQGARAPQQKPVAPQSPPAVSSGNSHSLCYWLPSWSTSNWWNAPATAGGTAVPTYNRLAQPPAQQFQAGNMVRNPTTVCYSGCVPSWIGSGYTVGAACAPTCY